MRKPGNYCLILVYSGLSLVFSGCSNAVPSNYYVSNNGNDNANGRTPQTAWKTISRVNSKTFIAGDSILFERGGTWYEELAINSSGNRGQYLVYSTYGKGSRPRILGSASITAWEKAGNNIWKSASRVSDPSVGAPHNGGSKANNRYPGGSWFEEQDGTISWGHVEKDIKSDADLKLLESEYDWGWYNGYIYIWSADDPAKRYKSMQASQRQSCIKIAYGKPQQYITISGLELMFAQSSGFYSGYPEYKANGLNFYNCNIGFIGIKGAAAAYGLSIHHSDMVISGNIIHDCGRRGISYNMYKSTGLRFSNVIVENNTFYNGFHTTSIDVSSLGLDTIENFIFRNNLVFDDPASTITEPEDFSSNSIYIAASANSCYRNFFIYNNIILNSKARLLLVGKVDSLFIVNNTFYGVNRNAKPYSMITFTRNNSIVFANNIVYGNMPSGTFAAYCMLDERGDTRFIERDFNLYYQEDPKQLIISTDDKYYYLGGWETYKINHSQDIHSPNPSDPLFVDPPFDMGLRRESPAIGAGKPFNWLKRDFYGNAINNKPDLGAIQFGSKPGRNSDAISTRLGFGSGLNH